MAITTTQAPVPAEGPVTALGAERPAVGPAAVVLLAGSVRESELARQIGRSLLDLPLGAPGTVLDAWAAGVAALAGPEGVPPLRVLLDRSAPAPRVRDGDGRVAVTIERDPREFRGTGGLLRDLAEAYGEEQYLLVANGHQVLFQPLVELARALAAPGADVAVLAHEDSTPCGVMLVRAGALRTVRGVGFADLKEQVLPALAGERDVRVVFARGVASAPVRTLDGYLQALRRLRHGAGPGGAEDPFAEEWFESFSLVEEGAEVESPARVHDSVVLRGGRVGAGAVVVRALVCPGGVVGAGEVVHGRAVTGPARRTGA
ncbi:MAG TPA: hypothetical protein VD963_10300 [Phycisphaerales bacterium]|nr:hypothetical protein [Phycisphaerales bacterium]